MYRIVIKHRHDKMKACPEDNILMHSHEYCVLFCFRENHEKNSSKQEYPIICYSELTATFYIELSR